MKERGPDFDVNTYIDVVNPDSLILGGIHFRDHGVISEPVIPNNVTIHIHQLLTHTIHTRYRNRLL
ncbi:MAG: hypothetical protein IPG99_14025 [Ignavibacteria bacterium]|nr:hypothetical protein [Ignavibacteria bacterium]